MSEPRYRYLKTRTEQGILVLTLSPSKLEGDEMAQTITEEIQAAVDRAGAAGVVIDLEHVQFLTSANFRPFLALRKKLQATGGRMVLCNLCDTLRELFEITRMIGSQGAPSVIFEAQPDVEAAIAHLLPQPESTRAANP